MIFCSEDNFASNFSKKRHETVKKSGSFTSISIRAEEEESL